MHMVRGGLGISTVESGESPNPNPNLIGGQGTDAVESGESKFYKMTLGLKHYALYTVEEPRASFIPNVTAQDLWETFLPQYVSC